MKYDRNGAKSGGIKEKKIKSFGEEKNPRVALATLDISA